MDTAPVRSLHKERETKPSNFEINGLVLNKI
jgi:hypothetical protein